MVNIDAGLSYVRWIFDGLSGRKDVRELILTHNFTKQEAIKIRKGTADPLLEARFFDYFMKYALYGYSTGPYAELPRRIDRNPYVSSVVSAFDRYQSYDLEEELRNLIGKLRFTFPNL